MFHYVTAFHKNRLVSIPSSLVGSYALFSTVFVPSLDISLTLSSILLSVIILLFIYGTSRTVASLFEFIAGRVVHRKTAEVKSPY